MKIVVNPQYSILQPFVESLPDIFETEGNSIYKDRNELKCYEIENFNIVVKKFRKPIFINRFIYSYFRPTKAKRAYEYALKLLSMGVESPAPIAFIEQYKFGLFGHGYFVSIFEKEFDNIRDLMEGTQKDESLLKELAVFIADIHSKGILHLDMSPGNILYKKTEGGTVFSLVDINRMQFLPFISDEKRIKSFKRLTENTEILTKLANHYSESTHLKMNDISDKMIRYSTKFFASRN